MEINDFIDKFAEAIELDDASAISPETKFKELDEWNSLAILSLIAMVDEEYDIALRNSDIKTASTIQDLFELIKSKK